jgi:zinc protease
MALLLVGIGCQDTDSPSSAVTPDEIPKMTEIASAAPSEPTVDARHDGQGDLKPMGVAKKTVSPDGTLVATLDNGLTVIIREVRTAPVVCVRSYVRAGGMYEGEYLGCGISHIVEHLVAKGAVHQHGPGGGVTKPGEDTRSRVSEIGGQSNASTSMAYTQYYISAASDRAMECIDLISDWMARPNITREDFQREHGVIQREWEMGKDEPGRQKWYANAANIFRDHPAAVPVIGHWQPLRSVTYEDVLNYHSRMYVPQNMLLVIVGDVDADAALARTQQAMAGFGEGRVPDLSLPEVPSFAGVRRVVVPHSEVKETATDISFQTIPLVHEDLYALDVLSHILSKGNTTRLPRVLRREKQLVTSINTFSWTPQWGRGVFVVAFRSAPDKAEQAEQAVFEELRKVVEEGVTADELELAKRQKRADRVYSNQTVESQGSELASSYMSTGDVAFGRLYTDRIQQVTLEDVNAVARKYLTFDRYAVTSQVPAETFEATATAEGGRREGDVQTFALPNGLRVVLRPVSDAGLVSMVLAADGGLLLEDEQTHGLGTLMTSLSIKGADGRSAEEIDRFFSGAGGSLGGNSGNNTFYWKSTVLADSFRPALEVFADVVVRPEFPAEELEIIRPQVLAGIDRIGETWQGELNRYWRSTFFDGTPYQRMTVGSRDVVESATADQIARYHENHLKAGSSVLAVFGEFDPAEAREIIEREFAEMPTGEVEIGPFEPADVDPDGETHVLKTDKNVAGVIVSTPGMLADNVDDRLAITVLDTIISGYQLPSGWLHTELRGKRLVYVVHSYNWAGRAPGAFVTYAACQPANAPEVVEIIQKNLRKAADYLPSQDEVDRAVNMILTAEALDNQTMSSLAMSSALDELYGLGHDFNKRSVALYRKVTPEDVRRVGRKYLSSGRVVAVTTPQPSAFTPDAEAAGAKAEAN